MRFLDSSLVGAGKCRIDTNKIEEISPQIAKSRRRQQISAIYPKWGVLRF